MFRRFFIAFVASSRRPSLVAVLFVDMVSHRDPFSPTGKALRRFAGRGLFVSQRALSGSLFFAVCRMVGRG